MQRIFTVFVVLAALSLPGLRGQSDSSRWQVNGYVKYLNSTSFTQLPAQSLGSPLATNLVHHRLNLAYTPAPGWTLALGLRNRLFFADGQQAVLGSSYAQQIDQYAGLLDMSVRWAENDYTVLHSLVDRAYIDYSRGQWAVRAGRQRINWGVNLVWNPNDLFNALNFFDFDYEERPGNDAIRIQYYPGILSRLDIAVAPGRYDSTTVAAALYRFNTRGYDIQVLSGYYQGDWAAGGGWEGNIGNAGFKGEATYFYTPDAAPGLATHSLSATVSADYLFGNGLYLSGGVLYNSNGDTAATTASQGLLGNSLAGGALSAKNLFPAEWSLVANVSGSLTPLMALSGAVIYAPQLAVTPVPDSLQGVVPVVTTRHFTALVPTWTYSVREDWDIDLVGQLYFAEIDGSYKHLVSSVFVRLKWSY
ncbi:MAG: hypothetical protein OHK0039_16760 [Bacteroidia bacterium]